MNGTNIISDIAKMMKHLEDQPKPAIFGASRLISSDKAMRWVHHGQEYLVAHPDFWLRVPIAERTRHPIVEIHNLDRDLEMSARVFGDLAAAIDESMGVAGGTGPHSGAAPPT